MSDSDKLRELALARLAKYRYSKTVDESNATEILEELRVHQLELQMQNLELHRANETLQAAREWAYAMFEASAVPQLLVARELLVVRDANLAMSSLLGWGRRALSQQPMIKYFPPESHRDVLAFLELAWSAPSNQRRTLCTQIFVNGNGVKEVEIFPSRVNALEVDALLICLTDISERESQRRQLEQAAKEAKAANKQKTQFLANISHELRAPLASIIGYLDLVLKNDEPEKVFEMVRIARRAAGLLHSTVNDLLDLAQVEAERMRFKEESVSVGAIGQELIDMFQEEARAKGLSLTLELEGNLPTVVGDGYRIRQILMNLLMNALKFTHEGRVHLEVAYRQRHAIFVVEDTGIGIAPDRIESIFHPFEQGDVTDTRSYGGAGLGLSLCRRLAENMKGSIYVRSELGKGSRFTVQLPLLRLSWPVHVSGDTDKTTTESKRQLRILVCDDDEDILNLLAICLSSAGHHTHPVGGGEEALTFLHANEVDVVILDMQMPGMSGYDVVEEIRKKWSKDVLPVLAVTASAMDNERSRVFTTGCNGLLTKPIDVHKFASQVERFLESDPYDGQ